MPAASLTPAAASSATPLAYAEIPLQRPEASTMSPNLVGVWLVTAISIALVLWWFGWRTRRESLQVLRRFGTPRQPAALNVAARLQLTPQASLHVVRWNGTELLIGCHPNAMTVIDRRLASAQVQPLHGVHPDEQFVR